jgi:hypothetical protein
MVRSFAVANLHQSFDGQIGMDMITKRRRRSDQRVTVGLAMMAAILSFIAVQEVAGGASAAAAQQSPIER